MTDNPAPLTRHAIARERARLVCYDLDSLLRAAAWQWRGSGGRIYRSRMAETLGVLPVTLADIAANKPAQINFPVAGLIAWYFGVDIDQVVHYLPPAAEPAPASPDPAADAPHLLRRAPPLGPPGPNAITIVNHIPALLASQRHDDIAAATGQQQTSISRLTHKPLNRLSRATIADLIGAFGASGVSDLVEVHLALDSYAPGPAPARDAICITTAPTLAWRHTDWVALVRQWRALAGAATDPAPQELDAIDVAAIRYIMTAVTAQNGGRPPRLGGALAQALGVSRQAVHAALEYKTWAQVKALDLPEPIQRLIHTTLAVAPLSATDSNSPDALSSP